MKKTTKKDAGRKTEPVSYTSYRAKEKNGNTYNLEEYRRNKSERKVDNERIKSQKKSKATPQSKPKYNESSQYKEPPRPKQPSRANKTVAPQAKSPELRRAEMKQKNKLTRAEVLKIKERKRKAQQFRLFGVSVVIIFCVYASVKLVQTLNTPKISYQTVQRGVIDNSKKLEGLIVRDEKVYTSADTGNLHYMVNEGQKVAKNKEVCMIAEDTAVSTLGSQLEDIDRSIYNLQEKREDLSSYQPELYDLNTLVGQEMNQFYNQFGVSDTDRVHVLRKELNHIIQTRTNIYVEDKNVRTENLQADRVAVSQNLEGKKKVSYAKDAGIVSYNIDGQESNLSKEILEKMDYSLFKEAISKSKKGDGVKTILHAIEKEPLYKIVTKDEWSVVTYLSVNEAAQYDQGKKYELIFPEVGNLRVSFTLTTKEEQDNKVKLVFQTRDQITKFLPYRMIEFTVGETRAEGLKIPLQAILEKNLFPIPEDYVTDQDHQKGVIRKKGEISQFVPIDIQYTDEGKVFMIQEMNKTGAIMVGDVIKHPETNSTVTIKDVQTVQGVYTVNGRYARFKPVEVILTNEEYGIVGQSGKTKLKEFDQIISNPKSINQDQLLRSMNIQNE